MKKREMVLTPKVCLYIERSQRNRKYQLNILFGLVRNTRAHTESNVGLHIFHVYGIQLLWYFGNPQF